MPAQYRLLSAAGQVREDGDADVEVADGALVVAPPAGAALRVPFASIASVAEAEPFTLRVGLADGTVIELSRLGVMRTQVLAELRDGVGEQASRASAAVGDAEVFSAQAGGRAVEARVHDDALLIAAGDGSERVSFSFVTGVSAAGYVVTVEVAGGAPVTLSRLGRRTSEFADLLNTRVREARSRTSAFLAALLPGLGPLALREAAALLRDGMAAPAAALTAIHPDLFATLVEITALPARAAAAAELGRRADLAIGFKQLTSARRAAAGTTAWRDHAAAPHTGEHESPGGSFAPGLAGMIAAGVMSSGPPMGWSGGAGIGASGPAAGTPFGFGQGYGDFGGYWAYRALGAGMNSRQARPMAQRPDVRRGRLTPATEDLSALTVTGDDPTVLAFLLARRRELVLYEALNVAEPATFAYTAAGPDGLSEINRALDDCGFDPAAVHAGGLRAQAAPRTTSARRLAGALAERIDHGEGWAGRVAALLPG